MIRGHAHIAGLGAREPTSQRVAIGVLRKGRWRRVRMHLWPARLRTTRAYRPDLIRASGERLAWAGFEAELDPRRLGAGQSREGDWELFAHVRSGLVVRRRAKFLIAAAEMLPAVHLPQGDDRLVKAAVTTEGA